MFGNFEVHILHDLCWYQGRLLALIWDTDIFFNKKSSKYHCGYCNESTLSI